MQRNRLANMLKYLEPGSLLQAVPISIAYDAYRILEYAARGHWAASRAMLAGPAHQGIAAQRNTGCHQGLRGLSLRQALEYPIDLDMVARMVGTRRQVQFTAATPKVGDRQLQAVLQGPVGKGLRVVTG